MDPGNTPYRHVVYDTGGPMDARAPVVGLIVYMDT